MLPKWSQKYQKFFTKLHSSFIANPFAVFLTPTLTYEFRLELAKFFPVHGIASVLHLTIEFKAKLTEKSTKKNSK